MFYTEDLANRYFNGDIKKAIVYIMLNFKTTESRSKYYQEWSSELREFSKTCLEDENYEKLYNDILKQSNSINNDLDSLHLSKLEVETAEKNPYKRNIFIDILLLALGIPALLLYIKNPVIHGGFVGKFLPLLASIKLLGIDLPKYLKWKKLKEKISQFKFEKKALKINEYEDRKEEEEYARSR